MEGGTLAANLVLVSEVETVPPSELATVEETVESERKLSFHEFKVPVFPVALSSTVMVQMPLAFLPLKILRELSGRYVPPPLPVDERLEMLSAAESSNKVLEK